MSKFKILISCCCIFFIMKPVNAEDIASPVIENQAAGNVVINGRAAPGSAPITIFDLSFQVRTALGKGISMDEGGNFAVTVSPPLIDGHEIVAEDKDGRVSPPAIVQSPLPLIKNVR